MESLDLEFNKSPSLDLNLNLEDKLTEKEDKADKKKKKPMSIWQKLFPKKKMDKPKNVAILYLRDSGRAEGMVLPSKDGMFFIEGRTYHERNDCIYTLNSGRDKLPLAIIKESHLTSDGTNKWSERSVQEKLAELQNHVIKGIRREELVRMGDRDGKKMDNKTMILIIVGIIIAIAVFSGYVPGIGG